MAIQLTTLLLVSSVLTLTLGVPLESTFTKNSVKKSGSTPSYIVVLKRDHDSLTTRTLIDRVPLGRLQKVKKFEKLFHGFSAEMDEETLDMVRSYGEVDFIEENIQLHAYDNDVSPWGLDRIDQRDLPLDDNFTPPGDGTNIDVYVVDTGIRYDHEEFEGRAKLFFDAIEGDPAPNGDCNGHGTHCAGTIGGRTFGVAKNVSLWGVRVLNCNGSGSLQESLTGLEMVLAYGNAPAVISMSLGGPPSKLLNSAVSFLENQGYVMVVAAGNEDKDACKSSPAAVQTSITVGASDKHDERAYFSNYGKCVDVYAPGVDIASAYYESSTDVTVLSGTSMATPHVSGVAAIMIQMYSEHHPTPAKIKALIINSATPCHIDENIAETPNLLLYASDTCERSANTCMDQPLGGHCANGEAELDEEVGWWWWWIWRKWPAKN